MNPALKEIAQAAGAPKEVIDTLWFSIFCQNFAHLLLEMAEAECREVS